MRHDRQWKLRRVAKTVASPLVTAPLDNVGGESMKNGFVIFLAAFAVLVTSWSAFVLGPQLQLGGAKQVAVLNSSDLYPDQPARRGDARACKFIAQTAAPRATPNRCSRTAWSAMWF